MRAGVCGGGFSPPTFSTTGLSHKKSGQCKITYTGEDGGNAGGSSQGSSQGATSERLSLSAAAFKPLLCLPGMAPPAQDTAAASFNAMQHALGKKGGDGETGDAEGADTADEESDAGVGPKRRPAAAGKTVRKDKALKKPATGTSTHKVSETAAKAFLSKQRPILSAKGAAYKKAYEAKYLASCRAGYAHKFALSHAQVAGQKAKH